MTRFCMDCGWALDDCHCSDGPRVATEAPDDEAARLAQEQFTCDLASSLKQAMPENTGFVLVLFDYGHGGNMSYMSTGERSDCINMLRELLTYLEAPDA